ncbi:Hypothetical predicted protein [Podarcis lilfordi]|uniref:Uncharacterized protein n=1 Tax=Podarcis lilfordi TaxID=74358 RepID=A0AA35LMV1_9SAUR|nr:Hypothetical predicted protein [Podarcis lilfordi]
MIQLYGFCWNVNWMSYFFIYPIRTAIELEYKRLLLWGVFHTDPLLRHFSLQELIALQSCKNGQWWWIQPVLCPVSCIYSDHPATTFRPEHPRACTLLPRPASSH